jgi:hypothetical protein
MGSGTGKSRDHLVQTKKKKSSPQTLDDCHGASLIISRQLFLFHGDHGPILGVRVNSGAPGGKLGAFEAGPAPTRFFSRNKPRGCTALVGSRVEAGAKGGQVKVMRHRKGRFVLNKAPKDD